MEYKKCYICKIVKSVDEFYFDNKEKTKLQSKCKSCSNSEKNLKVKKNTILKIIHNQKRRIRQICKENGFIKNETFDKYFGIKTEGFKKYLEELFYDEISWDNYNIVWQVDHKIPLLNVSSFEELKKISHYTNLQPLLIEDHKKKSTKDLQIIFNKNFKFLHEHNSYSELENKINELKKIIVKISNDMEDIENKKFVQKYVRLGLLI